MLRFGFPLLSIQLYPLSVSFYSWYPGMGLRKREIFVFEEKLVDWELCKAPGRKWDLSLHQDLRPVRPLRLEVVGWMAEGTQSSEPRTACLIDIKPNLVDR